MAEEHTCDCCKRCVEVISDVGLCFVCVTFQTFTAIIKDETELNDEGALDLASVLANPSTDGHPRFEYSANGFVYELRAALEGSDLTHL